MFVALKLANGYTKGNSQTYSSSSITAANLLLGANNINITSSSLNADAALELMAKENINILSNNNLIFTDTKLKSSSGMFGSKVTQDTALKESVVSSSLTANNISMFSAKDTNLQAANLKATETIQVDALGDINIIAKEYREAEIHYTKKSGFLGLSSSLSIDQSDAVKLHEATLKTEAKNIIMNSGKDINVVASEVNSAADVALRAFENLNIVAGEEVESEKHIREKTSFNPLGVLGLVGIDAGAIYTQDIHKQDAYDTTAKSSTIKAGGSITADTGTTNIIGSNLSARSDVDIKADIGGVNISSAGELHNASSIDKKTEVKVANLFNSVSEGVKGLGEDTKLKLNLATAQFDESTTKADSIKNVASSLKSGKNITIDSSDDITIKGSDVTAKDNIELKSKTSNISITQSIDTTNTQNKEKHAKADINLVVQNEYVETAVAVDEALKAAQQLKQTKEDYSNYKREAKKLEATLETLQTQYKEKVAGVDYSDIEDLKEVISNTKEDEKYYLAAITLATVDLASKTAAVASQAAAAAASTPTLGFSAGLSLDMQGSKNSTDTTTTKSNASNLAASNINIATDKSNDTRVTISGSNLNATDMLNIDTHNLHVIASTDTTNSNSSSKQLNGSVSLSVYGGGASGISLGYGENHADGESETNHNSNLNANTMNITASNDANFKGVTVRADDTLNLTVGNNLNVESVRNSSNSSSHGMNASLEVSAGGHNTSLSSANASMGTNQSRSSEKQTVLTSLTGDKVNITTGENTHLKGSLIAAGQTDENGVFQDKKNLNLSTKTLTFENSTNTKSSNSQGLGMGVGVNPQGDISSASIQLSTGTSYERTKTLATLGNGNINIIDKENSDDLERLNTDTTKVDKSLFKTDTGTSVDATLDMRLLTAKGREEIKQQYNDMDENMKAVSDTLPNAKSDNKIEAAAGTVWDTAVGLTGGILPSHANNGGVLGEMPILSGDKDSVQKMLQVVSANAPKYNEENFIPIEQSDAYKQMDEKQQKQVAGLYISKEPVTITKDNATYQNGGNGIMNNEGLATFNVLEQTGMLNQLASSPNTPVEATVFYNPTRGMVADLLESAVDTMGGTTGIAKQAGEFTRDVTTARGANGSNFTDHSQKNILTYSGINYINSSDNTGAKFQNKEYFYTGKVDADNEKVYNLPTFVSFGSPVSGETMRDLIGDNGLKYTYMGAFTKSGDFVGEGLGGNSGVDEEASIVDRINIFNTLRLFTGEWSPHGSYDSSKYIELNSVMGYKK